MIAALLRDIAGETFDDIARREKATLTDAWRRFADHRHVVESDVNYGAHVADLARWAIDRNHAPMRLDVRGLGQLAGRPHANRA